MRRRRISVGGLVGPARMSGRRGREFSIVAPGTPHGACITFWEHMVDYKDGQFQVNLLLNRASRWADVYSYLPYQGRVDLKMKEQCRKVRVRAPEWVDAESPLLV